MVKPVFLAGAIYNMSENLHQSKVKRGERVFWSIIDGEGIILKLDDGKYFKLNEVGTAVVDAIKRPRKLYELAEEIASCFDVAIDQALSDTVEFVHELSEQGLLDILSEADGEGR
jgi:hypothetical protein